MGRRETHMTQPGYRIYDETKRRIAAHAGPIFIVNGENPGMLRARIGELGVVWDDGNCRRIVANLSLVPSLCTGRRK